jgi:hypothetical protein
MPNAGLSPAAHLAKGEEVTTVPPWYRAMRSILADVVLVMFIPRL